VEGGEREGGGGREGRGYEATEEGTMISLRAGKTRGGGMWGEGRGEG